MSSVARLLTGVALLPRALVLVACTRVVLPCVAELRLTGLVRHAGMMQPQQYRCVGGVLRAARRAAAQLQRRGELVLAPKPGSEENQRGDSGNGGRTAGRQRGNRGENGGQTVGEQQGDSGEPAGRQRGIRDVQEPRHSS